MQYDILIRPAIQQDAQHINVLTEELGYKNSLSETIVYLDIIQKDVDHAVFVAVIGGKLIGWIEVACVTRLESGSFCEIVGLIVNEKYRGVGAGKLLVNSAIKWSREKNSKKIRVRCNVNRHASHLFYENIGFSIIKEQKVFELKTLG
jgi:GNAT superfamily N-acetyltransferase